MYRNILFFCLASLAVLCSSPVFGQKADRPVDHSLPPKIMGDDAARSGIDLNDTRTFSGRFISIRKMDKKTYRLKAESNDGKVTIFESFPIAVSEADLDRSREQILVTYVLRPNGDGTSTKVVHGFKLNVPEQDMIK